MQRTTVLVPREVTEAAKRSGINLSQVCRDAIIAATGAIDVAAEVAKLEERLAILKSTLPNTASIIDQYEMKWAIACDQMTAAEWQAYIDSEARYEEKRKQKDYPGDTAYRMAFKEWLAGKVV